jgi:predicted acetyltransferase
MDAKIRTISDDELVPFVRANDAAFSAVPDEDEIERTRRLVELDRCFAAFDGSEIVGTAAVFTMPMTVPAGELSVGYVTAVGVKPTHRRRGINTGLMRRQLEQARERGEPVDVLYASEGGIYGRFGYGLATFGLAMEMDSGRSAFVRGYQPSGSMRLVERADGLPRALAVHDAVRPGRPGMVALTDTRMDDTLHEHGPDKELPLFVALHEGPGGVDGYVLYRVRHDWRGGLPRSTLLVKDLQATNPGATADLWRYVFDVDLTERVRAWNRAVDDPLLHLVAEPRRLRATLRDNLWLRLVDVAAALPARRYSSTGAVVLEVHDPFCPWNEGRYLLEAAPDGTAVAARTDREPDVVCAVSDLGAAYLGGTSFRRLHRAGLVRERTDGALARADAMFTWDPEPWCPYIF